MQQLAQLSLESRLEPSVQSFVLSAQLEGQYIVSSKDCTAEELELAKADGRYCVSMGGRGYVRRK